MRSPILMALLTFLVGTAVFAAAADKVDFTQPQSPPAPTPAWLKSIDQGQHDPRLKGYKTPAGIKVEIVAEEPVVINPVAMTFALDGTPHVLEWRPEAGARGVAETFTYRDGSVRKVATMKKTVKDVVKVLTDGKKQGRYDEARVILEDELPSSILLHDGWLYLSGRGTVRRYRQSKPGGDYDVKEVIVQGFCGYQQQQVSGMTIGPDGWLYLTAGEGDNVVEGSDGSRATVIRTGAVFRCRPNGARMHTFARGFRNPYRDVAFDAAGNLFHTDNDIADGGKFTGCRLMHIAEGCDFGWRLRAGSRCCVPDLLRAAASGELPGTLPPLIKTGRGAAAGLLIYNDSRFPEPYRGLLYYPDMLRQSIRAYKVERNGASFEVVEEFEFLKSDDPLFRPCQMVAGPDGALYVVDWRTDSSGVGRLGGDGKHGRIYRISWAGTEQDKAIPRRDMDSWAAIVKQDDEELIKTLAHEEGTNRQVAQNELRRRGDKNCFALRKLLADSEAVDTARYAALGVLHSFWNEDVQHQCENLLLKGDADMRRLCAEAIGLNAAPADRDVQSTLLKALVDGDPQVRRAIALAMSRLGAAGAADVLVNTLAFDDGQDRYLRDGLVRAIEGLGKPGIERLIALADSGVAKDLERVVETFAALRDRPGAEALPGLLTNPHLTIDQRATLVRSHSNYLLDPPLALAPVMDYFLANPHEASAVKLAGLTVLSAGDSLKGEKESQWLLKMLDDNDAGVRLAAIKAVENVRLPRAVARLEAIGQDENRPPAEREAAVKVLRVLNERAPRLP